MKITDVLPLLAVVALTAFHVQAGPAAQQAEPLGYRLTVELKDGSRIIGKSREEHFEFRSESLGEMKLPLEKVRSVERDAKGKEARLVTAAQDSLKVEFAMKDIHVDTAFGEVKLPIEQIKSVHVSVTGGPGRPTDGLIGFWSGDGNADDSVGGNNGEIQNVSYVDGVAGKAFSFSPNGGFGHVAVNVPDKHAYVLTEALSIDAWIRPRGDGNVVITRGDNRPGMDPYTISMDGHHAVIFQITDDSGQSADVRSGDIPYGQWTHVAGTFESDSGMIRIYTNGVLAAEKKTDVRPIGELIENQSPGVGIGNVNDGFNNFPFVGDIGDVALYNRALSAKEVKAVYAEHAAMADGKADLLPTSQRQRFGFRNGLPPGVRN